MQTLLPNQLSSSNYSSNNLFSGKGQCFLVPVSQSITESILRKEVSGQSFFVLFCFVFALVFKLICIQFRNAGTLACLGAHFSQSLADLQGPFTRN